MALIPDHRPVILLTDSYSTSIPKTLGDVILNHLLKWQ